MDNLGVIRNGKISRMMNLLASLTFFLNANSARFDHTDAEAIAVEATAISTPLDKVPLYIVAKPSCVVIMLLKSSQAVSSSGLFNLGTPRDEACVIE